jgi:hypothetical protein
VTVPGNEGEYYEFGRLSAHSLEIVHHDIINFSKTGFVRAHRALINNSNSLVAITAVLNVFVLITY